MYIFPVQVSQRENRVPEKSQRIPIRKVVKRSNRLLKALHVPSVMNINPRSDKVNEFLTLVEQYESDLIFMSETWDRVNQPLETLIQIDGHKVLQPNLLKLLQW